MRGRVQTLAALGQLEPGRALDAEELEGSQVDPAELLEDVSGSGPCGEEDN